MTPTIRTSTDPNNGEPTSNEPDEPILINETEESSSYGNEEDEGTSGSDGIGD